jgi:hypothetical protein
MVPVFEQIAEEATRLYKEGKSYRAIGRELGVDPKTALKGIRWLNDAARLEPISTI